MSNQLLNPSMSDLVSITNPKTNRAETPIEEIDINMQGLYAYLRERCPFQVETLYSCGGHTIGTRGSCSSPYLMLSVSMEGVPLVLGAYSRANKLVSLSETLQGNPYWGIERHFRSEEESSPVWTFRTVCAFIYQDTQEMVRILHQAFVDVRECTKTVTLNDPLKELAIEIN